VIDAENRVMTPGFNASTGQAVGLDDDRAPRAAHHGMAT
jgi:hypothetical protein